MKSQIKTINETLEWIETEVLQHEFSVLFAIKESQFFPIFPMSIMPSILYEIFEGDVRISRCLDPLVRKSTRLK